MNFSTPSLVEMKLGLPTACIKLEDKRQSQQCRHTSLPTAKKFKTTISAKKITASGFWDSQGIILNKHLPQGETINTARYCETLKKIAEGDSEHEERHSDKRSLPLHNNARLHTGNATKLLASFKWDILNHPVHSPDLAPSDYNLFNSLKLHMGGKGYSTDEEVEKWMKGLVGNYFEEGFKKLIARFTTCIEEW